MPTAKERSQLFFLSECDYSYTFLRSKLKTIKNRAIQIHLNAKRKKELFFNESVTYISIGKIIPLFQAEEKKFITLLRDG